MIASSKKNIILMMQMQICFVIYLYKKRALTCFWLDFMYILNTLLKILVNREVLNNNRMKMKD